MIPANSKKLKTIVPIFLAVLILLLLLPGCTTPSESEYESEVLAGQERAEGAGLLGLIIQEWKIFSIIFMMLTISLIALAYPVSTALSLPELRAWADVELSESFSTVLIVIFAISILVFAEFTTHAFLITSNEFSDVCEGETTFCPALVAEEYIGMYISQSEGIYEDLQKNAMESGKIATYSVGSGINYWLAAYISTSWKPFGNEIITVNMIMQELQLLASLRDALIFQEFLINHVSLILAPMSLMLGIILRSFFVTRKLGGQLMAFGIGFLLVYPATYALAMYTVKATIYGSEGTGAAAGGEFCTATCMKLPPVAYNKSSGGGYTWTEVLKVIPQQNGETDQEYENRTTNFLEGEVCHMEEKQVVTYDDDGLPNGTKMEEQEVCEPNPETEIDTGNGIIVSCGQYNDICPPLCRTLPYPNQNPDCASGRTEYLCREHVAEECFLIKYVNRSDPRLSGLKDYDFEGCPLECRPVIGLKKEGCDTGYGFVLNESLEENPDNVDEIMEAEGWEGDTFTNALVDYCNESIFYWWGDEEDHLQWCEEEWVPSLYDDHNTSVILNTRLAYDDAQLGRTIEWDMGCSNKCRWVTTNGSDGFGCNDCEMYMEEEPQDIWDEASEAAEDGDLQGQIAAAEKTCVMIIPDIVFENPSACSGCNYVLDRGFGSLPPVHLDCPRLCGMPQSKGMKSDSDSRDSMVDGFAGPAEMKSISALIVPSLIIPLLNLTITFIFIRTLSPIIGGGVDISGMMRFFK